VEPDST